MPKFLDDPSFAMFLRAARDHCDLFTRVCVEVLARTGLRRSELVGLTIDAIVPDRQQLVAQGAGG